MQYQIRKEVSSLFPLRSQDLYELVLWNLLDLYNTYENSLLNRSTNKYHHYSNLELRNSLRVRVMKFGRQAVLYRDYIEPKCASSICSKNKFVNKADKPLCSIYIYTNYIATGHHYVDPGTQHSYTHTHLHTHMQTHSGTLGFYGLWLLLTFIDLYKCG